MDDANQAAVGGKMGKLMGIYKVFGYIKLMGAVISGMAIFAMMSLIVADVVSRNFLGGSIAGSFEIVQNYFMPLAVFPALAYVYGSGVLPKMDFAMLKLTQAVQDVVVYLLLLVELVLFALLAYYTWEFAVSGMDRGTEFVAGGELYLLWPLFFVVPVSFALVLLETLFVVVNNVLGDKVTISMHHGPEVEAL
jgi:TRAP-type C4-dicarboxylate transport system permease small subunit